MERVIEEGGSEGKHSGASRADARGEWRAGGIDHLIQPSLTQSNMSVAFSF